jgi:hypothetical protein
MNFITHKDRKIETVGSSLHGFIQATYVQIEAVFGKPMLKVVDPNNDVTYWAVEFEDGTVATIYAWCDEGEKPDDIVAWHIGCKHSAAVSLVHDTFREAFGFSRSRAA